MNSSTKPHEWSVEAFLLKAERYAEIMLTHDRNDWQFGFWSALALEMIVRAALSNISPVLLAEDNWNNLLHALGRKPVDLKGPATSIGTKEVLRRLEKLIKDFNQERLNFCSLHTQYRNSELHTGDVPFDAIAEGAWLPKYYDACSVLLISMGKDIADVFGGAESKTALMLISALCDEAAKEVKQVINAHKTIWSEKTEEEKDTLNERAQSSALRIYGHRVNCPACGSIALVTGTPSGDSIDKLDGDTVVQKQPMVPSHFECSACQLRIAGYSKLNACGLGGTYTQTQQYDTADYFGIVTDMYHGYDEDNNEP